MGGAASVESAMVSELLARIAERELYQCLACSEAVVDGEVVGDDGHGPGATAAAGHAMIGVGLRELGALYNGWATWAEEAPTEEDEGDEEAAAAEDSEEPQAMRQVKVGSAAACEEAVQSVTNALSAATSASV